MATLPEDEAVAGRTLHLAYTAGDPTASNEIFVRYYDLLNNDLRAFIARKGLFLRIGDIDDLAGHAIIQAFESYLRRPETFNPDLKTLGGYLILSAQRDFLNLFAREMRRESAIESGVVRLDVESWNTLPDEDTDLVAEIEDASAADDLLAFARSCAHNDEDRTVLTLMLTFEKKTGVFAEALGIAHLPERDQRAQVNKIKDRLSKRLKRGYRGGSADG
jgi:hypothetical protein